MGDVGEGAGKGRLCCLGEEGMKEHAIEGGVRTGDRGRSGPTWRVQNDQAAKGRGGGLLGAHGSEGREGGEAEAMDGREQELARPCCSYPFASLRLLSSLFLILFQCPALPSLHMHMLSRFALILFLFSGPMHACIGGSCPHFVPGRASLTWRCLYLMGGTTGKDPAGEGFGRGGTERGLQCRRRGRAMVWKGRTIRGHARQSGWPGC